MRALTLFISLFIFTNIAGAQNQISVNAAAEVLVPADKIAFQINVNAVADTPQEAYDLHKKREQVLVQQLKKYNIDDKNIRFEPISINKSYNGSYRDKKEKQIQSRQTVVVTLEDFKIYEKIQITLIENGFDEFSGNFSSSESQQGEDEALKKALTIARQKAQLIAEENNLKITGIKNINHSYSRRPPRPMMEATAMKSSDSLMEFDQSVSVAANVSVTYEFE